MVVSVKGLSPYVLGLSRRTTPTGSRLLEAVRVSRYGILKSLRSDYNKRSKHLNAVDRVIRLRELHSFRLQRKREEVDAKYKLLSAKFRESRLQS